MHHKILIILLIFSSLNLTAQITGKVTDTENKVLPYVNIYTENGKFGTTSNENGIYELKIESPGDYNLVFQFLGYQTQKKTISIEEFPYQLNVSLKPETTTLDEINISSDKNLANAFIKKAIEFRKQNAKKLEAYTASFYSRGLWRIENAPEKILGQEVGDLGGGLDSTRSGIVYLSETISKISYKRPDDFNEKIIASKVSGDDNGFSLNSAQESYFSFYENTIEINSEMVSPIAEYAFNYYNYKLVGTFYDENGNLINKIKVSPKREKDRVFSGYIYIVEDLWQIFGIELQTTGEAVQMPPIETLDFKQNYRFSQENGFYIQISQTVDFKFAMFGISGDGRFTAVYSNYNFKPDFNKNSFGNEIMSFAEAANKKDSTYWQKLRPVPLTDEEINDYVKKDSIQSLRNSKPYKDSIDAVRNKFNLSAPVFGYSWQDSFKERYLNISSPLMGTHFNTVQGWNTSSIISYRQNDVKNENSGKFWRLFTSFNYGFSDERFRIKGGFQKQFNNYNRPVLKISGGIETAQINDRTPISERLNDITSIFFERNYLKLYERSFTKIAYQQEVINGIYFFGDIGYEKRKPLFNKTDQVIIDNDGVEYTSNNPLQPENFGTSAFREHDLFKLKLSTRIRFGQKYMSYPSGKFNVSNEKYPTLYLGYEKAFGASLATYNFDHFNASVTQQLNLGNKGELAYNLKAGAFLNAQDMAFLDYRHFIGNQTRVYNGFTNVSRFNLLPYYSLSTNKTYAEVHAEHDFKGWVLGKIPFINRLNYNLVIGADALYTEDSKPYSEYSVGIDNLGFGKYRLLRLDYVISNKDGQREAAFVFGLKFLGIFD
ncbi:DUF5686 and carboxypeptidase regulatory-like domain-containing protein [Salegentibacter maritimus]|uniref:DUF5686 and carboxypeptidase regulatory-like domain-containing protein n=1 Tax=Salegentibacter maritimus TaxID=2794347 RepID=UPI0018E4BC6B|nr:DUF5686 and carboxypeptidase regulatory-like domain-containing protein [Salegentibacter maritimus]MBI6118263.1 carboxypeptidase-like regulatory domain-containing protein [Salegentibacter maritimus]